ncbi:MAG: HD domain-containing protein, partial [Nitrososphaera sp.]|nr:HD domain-containing protein [Nitrososphaera sp.]
EDPPHSGNRVIDMDIKNHLVPQKTFRIAVTGDVYVTRLEREIIDTLDFQRLGGVRQLGSVVHVYRTALHTRFDHCLGTLAMVDRMMRAVKMNAHSSEDESRIDPEQEVLARLYALLHDLPHVPFGHTIEDELGLILRHDQNPKRLLRFLGPDSQIGSIIRANLGKAMYDRFLSIYLWEEDKKWEKRRNEIAERDSEQAKLWDELENWKDLKDSDDAFIHDLVSNTVCADLLDYIARDNYFCNLGGAMEYRFINFLYLHRNADGRRRLYGRREKPSRAETP